MTRKYGRKVSLLVIRPEQQGNNPSAFIPGSAVDLSDMHFTFKTAQADVASPSNCSIRIYNLSEATLQSVMYYEYTRVILQAGYDEAGLGVIFDGTIKQFAVGKENATDTYLDILAADGDLAYNWGIVNTTLAAPNTSPNDRLNAIIQGMAERGVAAGSVPQFTGGVLPRGKVLFGMGRVLMAQTTKSLGATWTISNGKLDVTRTEGYKEGEAVVLSSLTGLVGIPEQTNEGLKAVCLLDPNLKLGGLVQIDNKTVNQLIQQNPNAAPVAFNQYTGIQNLATITRDGLYRLYVVEHSGDTRGMAWHSHLTLLAVNAETKRVTIK
jgi:hypothetical protein